MIEPVRFSQLTREWQQRILAHPNAFPMRVTFRGKTGLIDREEARFLLESGVDFVVDEEQLGEIIRELRSGSGQETREVMMGGGAPGALPAVEPEPLTRWMGSRWPVIAGIGLILLLAILALLSRKRAARRQRPR